jgi:hypothetical protein
VRSFGWADFWNDKYSPILYAGRCLHKMGVFPDVSPGKIPGFYRGKKQDRLQGFSQLRVYLKNCNLGE